MAETKTCPQCHAALPVGAPEGLCRACLLRMGLESNTVGTAETGAPARWVPPEPAALAARFPDLELLELLGRGGMGAVYKARQTRLDRLVALKILPPEIGQDRDFTERFAREAQAMARLNHPHIVTIHDFGQTNGLYFFVMEYVDGLNLRQVLDAERMASREALAIVPQICDALQYAHDQGIVHRDIKPENILLNRQGQVKIADFGLAKLVGADGPARGAERVMGTPQYMAPEQVQRPDEVDHRADIYSLGVVFYQMLTGEFPAKLAEPPSKKVAIDVRLDDVVLRALEKDPERRYQQVSEVKTQMETIASTPPVCARSAVDSVEGPPEVEPRNLDDARAVGNGIRNSPATKPGRAGSLRRSARFYRRLSADGDPLRGCAGVGLGTPTAVDQSTRFPIPFAHLHAEGRSQNPVVHARFPLVPHRRRYHAARRGVDHSPYAKPPKRRREMI